MRWPLIIGGSDNRVGLRPFLCVAFFVLRYTISEVIQKVKVRFVFFHRRFQLIIRDIIALCPIISNCNKVRFFPSDNTIVFDYSDKKPFLYGQKGIIIGNSYKIHYASPITRAFGPIKPAWSGKM